MVRKSLNSAWSLDKNTGFETVKIVIFLKRYVNEKNAKLRFFGVLPLWRFTAYPEIYRLNFVF